MALRLPGHNPTTHQHWHYVLHGPTTVNHMACGKDLFGVMTYAIGGVLAHMEQGGFRQIDVIDISADLVKMREDLDRIRLNHGFAHYVHGMMYAVAWIPEEMDPCLVNHELNKFELVAKPGPVDPTTPDLIHGKIYQIIYPTWTTGELVESVLFYFGSNDLHHNMGSTPHEASIRIPRKHIKYIEMMPDDAEIIEGRMVLDKS